MIIKVGERNFEKHRNKLEQGVMIEIMQRAFPDTEESYGVNYFLSQKLNK